MTHHAESKNFKKSSLIKTASKWLGAAATLVLISTNSYALPITGSNLTAELGVEFGGSFITQDSVTFNVGPGVDSAGPIGMTSIDASDTSIVLGGLNIGFSTGCCTFNGYRIFDTDGVIDDFISVTIDSILTTANIVASQLSFDANEIRINWAGAPTGTAVGNIVLNIETARSAIPEPSALLLLATGLIGFGLKRRASK